MLAQCCCWESDSGNEYTSSGTVRHDCLAKALTGDPDPFKGLDETEAEAVRWAADYIRVKAPISAHELRLEHRVNPLADDFTPIFENGGRLDVACGPCMFDLKNRERDYQAQMAAYALGMFQEHGWPEVEVHLLFAETRRAQVFRLTEESARAIVEPIVARVHGADKKPTPCDYCGWCSRRLSCPALLKTAAAVAHGYSELNKVKNWHPSEMQTGEELGIALWIARNVLKKWCESVEFHALRRHQTEGLTITGFEPKTKAGKSYVTDVPEAFTLAKLPQSEFLRGCQLRLNTSKKYPDQVGLVDIYKQFHGLPSTAAAKRDLMAKLEPVVKKTNGSTYLQAVKGGGEEEPEETT